MTVATEQPILEAVQTSIKALSPTSPAASTSNVYVYPDDYESTPDEPTLPFVIIRMAYGPAENVPHGLSSVLRQASLVIEVYTAEDIVPVPSSEHADSELKKRQWWKVITEWLLDDRTFTGTVDVIGNEAIFFTDERVYLQWNQNEYDGLYVTIPFIYQEC